jgi:hypothetical protein
MRLRATTVRSEIWRTCRRRLRLRSSAVASRTTTVTSGRPKRMKLRVTSSSAEALRSEYVPGRSTMR